MIPVINENTKLNLALSITVGTSKAVVNDVIETPLLLLHKRMKSLSKQRKTVICKDRYSLILFHEFQ